MVHSAKLGYTTFYSFDLFHHKVPQSSKYLVYPELRPLKPVTSQWRQSLQGHRPQYHTALNVFATGLSSVNCSVSIAQSTESTDTVQSWIFRSCCLIPEDSRPAITPCPALIAPAELLPATELCSTLLISGGLSWGWRWHSREFVPRHQSMAEGGDKVEGKTTRK